MQLAAFSVILILLLLLEFNYTDFLENTFWCISE